jgi:hypothetical protein
MNLTPDSFAEICKQGAFISALVAGFSFAFLGTLLISSDRKKITDWIIGFSIITIAGLLICSLAWTFCASRMALYLANDRQVIPEVILGFHRTLSFIFILSFFFFLVTLGLSGWIRSKRLGIISATVSTIALLYSGMIMRHFIF